MAATPDQARRQKDRPAGRQGLALQTRLTLWLLPMIVLPLLLLGWLAYTQLHQQLEQQHLVRMDTLLEQLDLHLQSKVQTAEANARLMMASALLRNYMRAEDDHERYELLYGPLLRLLESYQQAYPDVREIRLARADGSEDVRWTRQGARSVEGLPTGELLRDGHEGVQLVRDAGLGESLLLVARPVMLRDVRADPVATPLQHYGYLLLLVDLELVQRQMSAYGQAGQGDLMAVGLDGDPFLWAHDGNTRGEVLPPGLPAVMSRARAQMQAGAQAPSLIEGGDYYRTRVLDADHLWVAHMPGDSLRASTRGLAWTVALLVLAAVTGTFVMILLALRALVLRPLGALRQAAVRVGQGQWDLPVNATRNDEIGGLERAFETMVEQLREGHERIHFMAYHDELTGLPNRKLFNDHLHRSIEMAGRQGEGLAVLFLDMDRFKEINDRHGHDLGVRVLRYFADVVSSSVRDEDCVARSLVPERGEGELVARLGGDEFIVLLREVRHAEDVWRVTGRILDALKTPFSHGDIRLRLHTSIGVALFPQDGADAEQLLQRADHAMYRAKQAGSDGVCFYGDVQESPERELLDLQ
ncbi:MAG TPA: GGDEF domain-containing protein [Thioalkalivibrio sp.]|nr:GGDEF domain-containing protein [Thioalkalivibrio sp.]